MSDEMFYQDGDEYETNGMKALREKAEADSQAIRDLTETVNKLAGALQERDLKDAVTAKSLSPKVVELAKKAGVKDTEGLDTFLKDFGDVFAAPGSETSGDESTGEQPGGSTVPADEQAALTGMAAAAQAGLPQGGLEGLASQINGAQSADDLLKLLGVTATV